MNPDVQNKLTTFFAHCPTITYSKGDIILFAEREPKGVLFIVSGVVEKFDISPTGSRLVVNTYRPSAFFPMSWVLNRTTNHYFYAALTEVVVHQASVEETAEFLKANPDVALDLLRRMYSGLEGLMKRFSLTASGATLNRVILELLIEARRFGIKINNAVVVRISQSNIAARSGLARETVSRELRVLENSGLITRTRYGIELAVEQFETRLNM